MEEIYKRLRPNDFDQVWGQPDAIATLEGFLCRQMIPHTILFSGPSGCGKTTLARILKDKLGCTHTMDFKEVNAADARGIDDMRDIQQNLSTMAVSACKVYLIDEAHKLTTDAQNCLLKTLEDTPPHVYFMLASSEPNKLIKAIQSRCTEIKVKGLAPNMIRDLLVAMAAADGIELDDDVATRIVELVGDVGGGARKALVLLESVRGLDKEAALATVGKSTAEVSAFNICQLITKASMDGKAKWKAMAELLSACEDDPESVRHSILGYCKGCLKKGEVNGFTEYCFFIMDCFARPFYDTHAPGLWMACYEACTRKPK